MRKSNFSAESLKEASCVSPVLREKCIWNNNDIWNNNNIINNY